MLLVTNHLKSPAGGKMDLKCTRKKSSVSAVVFQITDINNCFKNSKSVIEENSLHTTQKNHLNASQKRKAKFKN